MSVLCVDGPDADVARASRAFAPRSRWPPNLRRVFGQASNKRWAPLHLAGTLGVDHWQGREEVQFRVTDAAIPAAH